MSCLAVTLAFTHSSAGAIPIQYCKQALLRQIEQLHHNLYLQYVYTFKMIALPANWGTWKAITKNKFSFIYATLQANWN